MKNLLEWRKNEIDFISNKRKAIAEFQSPKVKEKIKPEPKKRIASLDTKFNPYEVIGSYEEEDQDIYEIYKRRRMTWN